MKSTQFMAICGVLVFCSAAAGYPLARVTIEVVDEKGAPVPEAQVGMAMYRGNESGGGRGMTDANGLWTCEGRTDGLIGGGVRKDGYYRTEYRFILDDHVPKGVTVGRRYPDVTHRVVIRPKLKPVPMYAYQFSRSIPVEGEEIGIDLLKADWVAPHGKGEVADIMVKLISSPDSGPTITYGEIGWRFPGSGNGMIQVPAEDCHENSEFLMPRYAPPEGYISEWSVSRMLVENRMVVITNPEGASLPKRPKMIRIRSRFNEQGQLREALYGKIMDPGGITWRAAYQKTPGRVHFTYHVNPDGTRNMEFDPERNLFTDPPWDRDNFPFPRRP